jgi:hypothetical protein
MKCESGTAGKSPGSRYLDSTCSGLGAVIRPARGEGPPLAVCVDGRSRGAKGEADSDLAAEMG